MLPIFKNLVAELETIQRQENKLRAQIEARCQYIVKQICKACGAKLDWWDFNNGGEGVDGYFDALESVDCVDVTIGGPSYDDVAILKDGLDWGLNEGFPIRWLFEDFETELYEGIAEYKRREKAQKLKIKQQKEQKLANQKRLAESAKSKLTKEELKALKTL